MSVCSPCAPLPTVGPPGAPGLSGLPGTGSFLDGLGPPDSSLGINGDLYIDKQAGVFYGPKTSGAWGSPISTLTGAAGGDLQGNYPNPTLIDLGTPGTYIRVTVDQNGRVTSGSATLLPGDLIGVCFLNVVSQPFVPPITNTVSAWGSSGVALTYTSATYVDNTTGTSATATNTNVHAIHAPTISASNLSVKYDNAATFSVEAPVAGTNVTFQDPTLGYAMRSIGNFCLDGTVGTRHGFDYRSSTLLRWRQDVTLTPEGTAATGTLTLTSNVVNNDTVVLGATTYTFKNTLTGAANEVLIGTEATSILHLQSAINASAGSGTTYGTGTVANASASATGVTATTLTVTALLTSTVGSTVTTTSTSSFASWANTTLVGGGTNVGSDMSLSCWNDAGTAITTYPIQIQRSTGFLLLGSTTLIDTTTASTPTYQLEVLGGIRAKSGNIMASTVGKGLQVAEGSNAKQGTVNLTTGTVTVSNTSVTATSRIFVSGGALNATTAIGVLSVPTITAATSFVITSYIPGGTSTQTGDLRTVNYEIFEVAS